MPATETATLLIAHHDRGARQRLTEQPVMDGYEVLQASDHVVAGRGELDLAQVEVRPQQLPGGLGTTRCRLQISLLTSFGTPRATCSVTTAIQTLQCNGSSSVPTTRAVENSSSWASMTKTPPDVAEQLASSGRSILVHPTIGAAAAHRDQRTAGAPPVAPVGTCAVPCVTKRPPLA